LGNLQIPVFRNKRNSKQNLSFPSKEIFVSKPTAGKISKQQHKKNKMPPTDHYL